MDKIICDICGTSYAGSAECCPICGYSNGEAELFDMDFQDENFLEESVADKVSGGKKKAIFDFDEVNPDAPTAYEDEDEEDLNFEDEDENYDEDEEDEEEEPRHNTFAVILLTVLIVALLGAAAFIFFRFFLPNMGKEETVPVTTMAQVTEAVAETTEPTVPCLQMAMTNAGVAELSAEGQQFLLHIKALPENTTDKIVYASGDESIATVTEDGKITAVSEGETVIYISCGRTSMECPVIVKYVEETVPPTTEPVVIETAPAETVAEPTETVAEPVETQANTSLKDVKLKLKKTDIQLGVYYQFQLVLDCDLTPEEVTWTSEHPHIATVDEKGNVTAVKAGTTSITAKYGDQEVQCMVRCIWY